MIEHGNGAKHPPRLSIPMYSVSYPARWLARTLNLVPEKTSLVIIPDAPHSSSQRRQLLQPRVIPHASRKNSPLKRPNADAGC